MDDAAQLSYFAGFFDGEGSLCITFSNGLHSLVATLSQNRRSVLDQLAFRFGGCVYQVSRKNSPHKHVRPIYCWSARSLKVKAFLEALLPYLHIKKPAAQIGLEFLSTYDGRPVTDDLRGYRDALREEMRAYNRGEREHLYGADFMPPTTWGPKAGESFKMPKRKYTGSKVPLPGIPHLDLVVIIQLFCKIRGMGATAVTKAATGDDKLLWDLNGGRRLGKTKKEQLVAYLNAQILELDDLMNELEERIKAATRAPQLQSARAHQSSAGAR